MATGWSFGVPLAVSRNGGYDVRFVSFYLSLPAETRQNEWATSQVFRRVGGRRWEVLDFDGSVVPMY